ncbi:hypothetical protein Daura_23355 [Dactylosporangium aurantiacum]|uniref:Lipoprotein n=1 Tax=Dactylosporangium aurantiacum TaxID=35754 RepID=A0A9Q9IMF4_9ACTN|nr:hypothetical protein [Dactylosporangium aurantiacum]MDG6103975.1 hypothetical protein [Dactylosporangium aurantiacum]UWZ58847.1 hypothetical protein Daura_23355 [Dactylosporangium aurantiacum]
MKHRAPARRRTRWGGAASVVVALTACTGVVYHTSYAAFSASTSNSANTLTAGVLALTDNDSNAAMFNVSGLVPGASGSSCVTVSWSGTVTPSAPVQLFVAPGDATDTPGSGGGGVASSINWSVETAAGTGIFGSGGSCTGLTGSTVFGNTADTAITAGRMLSDFTAKNAYSAGATTSVSSAWTPVANVASTRVFRFNYKLATDAPNSAMGASAVVKITWETRS